MGEMFDVEEDYPDWHDHGKRVVMTREDGGEVHGEFEMEEAAGGDGNDTSFRGDDGTLYSFWDFKWWRYE